MNQITENPPLVLSEDDGEKFDIRGATIAIKAATDRLALMDHRLPGGFAGPPMHVHPGFDEVFLVLGGTLTLRVEDQVHEVGPGATAYVPGAMPHTFANTAPDPVRFMVSIAPGGFEEYLRLLAGGDEDRAMEVARRFGYAPWPA